MSASSTTRKQVHLPPLRLSDFVIHYRSADFHVHTFVLYHHSAYFRTYLDAMQPLIPMVTGKKRKSCTVDLSSLEERDDKCSHSPLVRCIDLPDEFGIKSPVQGYASEDSFLLFLQHLYFSFTLHSPPFAPKPELRAALTETSPRCSTFPASLSTAAELIQCSECEADDEGPLYFREPLLSLFHYFDCQAALKKCEAVILGPGREECKRSLWCWGWLPMAVRYGMKELEEQCLEDAVKDKELRIDDAEYKGMLEMLSRETLPRLLEASVKRK